MEEIVDYVLGLCKDAKYAEVRLEEIEDDAYFLKNGNPELGGFSTQNGIGVRLLINGTLGFASTNKLDKTSIKQMVLRAKKITKIGSRLMKEPIVFSEEKSHKKKVEVKMKTDPRDIDPAEKLKLLYDIDSTLTKSKVQVPARHFYLEHDHRKQIIANTEGTKITSIIPRVELYWFMTVKEKKDMRQRFYQYNSLGGLEVFKKWKVSDHALEIALKLKENIQKGKKIKSGNYSIICGPEVTGIASHESVGHPYEADRILGRESAQAGESFIKRDMVGEQIGAEIVNVVDNPLLEGTAGYFLYDCEGVKARKRYLLKNGKVNEFLHNRETAAKMGLKSNGCARAQVFANEPIVRMSNTYTEPGDWTHDEIIADTKEGIYMEGFQEWNIDDKRFNQKYVGSEAYYVKNGKIMYPLVAPVLEITTPKFWSAVDAIGKKIELRAATCGKGEPSQGVPVTTGGPSIRLKNIKIR
ncbi:TldD/PmbA family protein [Candidatus Woesearchaeota archaeon]|nr:TldD/PmbA family protein [Candidatus Woesearchaeota archaeon]